MVPVVRRRSFVRCSPGRPWHRPARRCPAPLILQRQFGRGVGGRPGPIRAPAEAGNGRGQRPSDGTAGAPLTGPGRAVGGLGSGWSAATRRARRFPGPACRAAGPAGRPVVDLGEVGVIPAGITPTSPRSTREGESGPAGAASRAVFPGIGAGAGGSGTRVPDTVTPRRPCAPDGPLPGRRAWGSARHCRVVSVRRVLDRPVVAVLTHQRSTAWEPPPRMPCPAPRLARTQADEGAAAPFRVPRPLRPRCASGARPVAGR